MQHKNLEALIEIAIEREEDAHRFYLDLSSQVTDKGVKDTLEFLAEEENKHKEFLINYLNGDIGSDALKMEEVIDFKVAEHLESPEPASLSEDKDAYLLAAHRELQSHNFYKALADIHPDGETKSMLLKIANEELKHKEKVEYLYSNTAFPQTAGG